MSDPWAATYAAVADLPAVWRWPMCNLLRDAARVDFGPPCLSDDDLRAEQAARTDWTDPS